MLIPQLARARRRALYATGALLLPVPMVFAGTLNAAHFLSAPSDIGAHAASVSATEQTPAAPHTTAPGASDAEDERGPRDGHDGGAAVVNKSVHQRVKEISANTTYDVPLAALNAYRNAAASVAGSYPACNLSWGVIAAIGQVESGHGRFGGASVLANGTTWPNILGVRLDGHGVAAIRDTDNGRLDGDKVWDRAVGPMQFIPSTWAVVGTDGDGDGKANPHDFDDASLSTARYLCSGGADMSVLAQARAAVLRYNHSDEYVDLVLRLANAYDSGVVDVLPNDVAPRTSAPPQPSPQPVAEPDRPTRQLHVPRHTAPKPPAPKPAPKPEPAPAPKPKPAPAPAPEPAPKPEPAPAPEPAPKPIVTTVQGVLSACGTSWCVAGQVLRTSPDLARQDYDADTVIETIPRELAGLEGGTLRVTITDGLVTNLVVVSLPPPPEPAPADPTLAPSIPTTTE